MNQIFKLIAGAILISFAISIGTANAEIFKWVDSNGKVHYSDRKIDRSAKEIDVSTGKQSIGTSNSDVGQRLANQNKYLNYLQSERLERKEKRDQQKAQRAKKNQYCATLKDQLKSFTEERARWYELDEATGDRRFISDAELDQRKNELQTEIKTNCS